MKDQHYRYVFPTVKGFSDFDHPRMEILHDDVVEYVRKYCPGSVFVVDAGCGRNMYKHSFEKVIGIDPADYKNADMHCTILEAYLPSNCADAVLMLGSVQFISKKYIKKNIKKIVNWTKPGGVIVCRVVSHNEETFNKFSIQNKKNLIPWTKEFLQQVTEEFNLEIVEGVNEVPWEKSSVSDHNFFYSPKYGKVAWSRRNYVLYKWVWKKN